MVGYNANFKERLRLGAKFLGETAACFFGVILPPIPMLFQAMPSEIVLLGWLVISAIVGFYMCRGEARLDTNSQ